ncbi:MAG: TIGR01212 family radical SAM protein [Halanaerobiales bacterium]|nr:TIGR01212 family radical SAM protein [Halanaerobiales bacterium]
MDNKPRYKVYSEYLKEKYGEKVYKLPINLPLTCPNRDGELGTMGCTFCGDEAAGFESLSNQLSVREQLLKNMDYIRENYRANKFIAYFQNFTNTYLPLKDFRQNLYEACIEDIVEINISTRPDCIHPAYLDSLADVKANKGVEIGIELGLQTVNYHTLRSLNRGHTLAEFVDSVLKIQKYGFEICAHIILNLPGDTLEDAIECAKILSAFGVEHVKIHSLYIIKGTRLASEFERGKFEIITMEEYIERVITFLEYLDPSIAIGRFLARAPKDRAIFCNWGYHWAQIKAKMDKRIKELDTYQGKKFNYLGGRGVSKFV